MQSSKSTLKNATLKNNRICKDTEQIQIVRIVGSITNTDESVEKRYSLLFVQKKRCITHDLSPVIQRPCQLAILSRNTLLLLLQLMQPFHLHSQKDHRQCDREAICQRIGIHNTHNTHENGKKDHQRNRKQNLS